jgi:two-component system, response regulator PdtaR
MEHDRRISSILVVEDDPLVRDMIVDVLLEAGFGVHEAGCVEEALRGLAQHPIDAVITDIDMPGELDGIDLARRINEFWPGIDVIVTSGGSRPAASLPRFARFLAKPFTAGRLLHAITGLIDARLCAAS